MDTHSNAGALAATSFGPSTWLRWAGAASFLAGALGFLVEGWGEHSGFWRSLAWSTITVSLACFGIVSLRRFGDALGARVFLALAAVTVPAHFAELGARTYACFVSKTADISSVAVSAIVLVAVAPVLALGVAALVRNRGLFLTLLVFALYAPLLVPTRDATSIALIAVAECCALFALEYWLFKRDARLQTLEGFAVRALLFGGPALILARNALYPLSAEFNAAALAFPGVMAVVLPSAVRLKGWLAVAVQALGALLLIAGSSQVSPSEQWFALSISAVALALAHIVRRGARVYGWIAVAAYAAFPLLGIYDGPTRSVLGAVATAPLGALVAFTAYHVRSRSLLLLSVPATLLAVCVETSGWVSMPAAGVWLFPSVIGVSLLVLASLAERRRSVLERRWSRLRAHFSESSHGSQDLPGAG